MTPSYIGPADRRLFTILHSPPAAARVAVLLCPPFGREVVRAHRLLRVLAERLARSGAVVLRFDPYGAGDSAGDDSGLNLAGWRRDLLAAHAHLVARSGASAVVWVGLRLGATVCALAAADAMPKPAHVLLCDPIVDGSAYLEQMRARHIANLDVATGVPPEPRAAETARRDAGAFRDEALGAAVPPSLRAELAALDGAALIATLGVDATVIVDPANPAGLRADAAVGPRFAAAAESVDWLADLTEDGTLLPGKLSAQLIKDVNDACA